MAGPGQTHVRWQPLPEIPETPCADFSLRSFYEDNLGITMKYSWIKGNAPQDLFLDFSEVRAFRVFWDGDNVWHDTSERPRCADGEEFWPLVEVRNSEWLAGVEFATSRAAAELEKEEEWRHLHFMTLQRHVDILARGPISAKWIPAE
jgi:hypothetical protein